MMCLESDGSSGGGPPGCGGRLRVSAAAGDDDEEEDDGGGGSGGDRGCCGRSGEVQTLSGALPAPGGSKIAANAERGCQAAPAAAPSLGRARVAAAAILSVGNVLNYLDRYTVAGVLLDIQQHFGVKDSGAGLLQTVFICSFMVAAPIFGYLGDRFNRKIILSCGIFFWSAITFSSSFITEQYFWLFVLSRGLVGIGEASYSTIAPTIIGDLFTKNTRTLMLSVFYFAIPLGSTFFILVLLRIQNLRENFTSIKFQRVISEETQSSLLLRACLLPHRFALTESRRGSCSLRGAAEH